MLMDITRYDETTIFRLDESHPGPWDYRDHGQNGYEILDASGVRLEGGRHGYDEEEDQRREALIVTFNEQVATALGKLTDEGELSKEFFRRKKGLTPRTPIVSAKLAASMAAPYRAIGKPHIADAISGVRYGRNLLQSIREFHTSKDKSERVPPFNEFAEAHAEGYFTLETIGTSHQEFRNLSAKQAKERTELHLEIIKGKKGVDERSQYLGLILNLNRAGFEVSSFAEDDQAVIASGIERYGDELKRSCLLGAKKKLEALRSKPSGLLWHKLKSEMMAGKLSPEELGLSEEERAKLENVLV